MTGFVTIKACTVSRNQTDQLSVEPIFLCSQPQFEDNHFYQAFNWSSCFSGDLCHEIQAIFLSSEYSHDSKLVIYYMQGVRAGCNRFNLKVFLSWDEERVITNSLLEWKVTLLVVFYFALFSTMLVSFKRKRPHFVEFYVQCCFHPRVLFNRFFF
jgi:hypothetical protein